MISEIQKQEILERSDIASVIGSYVPLRRKGRDYEANCPFHEEKTGSFKVSEAKKMWKCFGCGKGGNVIDFIMEIDNLTYMDAIKEVARRSGIVLDEKSGIREPKASMSKAPAQDAFSFEKKDFTPAELKILGREVTAELCQKEFMLFSVKHYITAKNDKGESWKVESADDYPIFVYDYGTWGKVYQPLAKPEFRFSYFGKKPDNYIHGDAKTAYMIEQARKGINPSQANPRKRKGKNEDGDDEVMEEITDERLKDLIIVSGGSDALNTRAAGYHVCWLNSETAELSDYDFKNILSRIAINIYVLYDLDATGIRNAQKLGLRFLDRIRIIWLPEDLGRFRDRRGKPCKDVKDFFNCYRNPKRPNNMFYFQQMVKAALPLCFWTEKLGKNGEFTGYDINNEQLYSFLNANGLYTIPNEQSKRGYSYVQIDQNIITEIKEEELQPYVGKMLVSFLRENLQYFNIQLVNSIHRSNQVKLGSLEKIGRTTLDMKSFSDTEDYLFFENTAVRVTKCGVDTTRLDSVGKYVHASKIKPFQFHKIDAPFEIEYSEEYLKAKKDIESMDPKDADYNARKKEFERFNPLNRFTLKRNDPDFCIMKYVYNTGRTYWRKEEMKIALTQEERREQDLHFINKVTAIGYLLYRFKEKSRGYMVYGMETELSELGAHLGGTGKSMFFEMLEWCRTVFFRDGQKVKKDDDETLFAGVKKGVTDIIYFDDLHKNVDLHFFMPMSTSKMTVRNLYENQVVIEFEESPKVAFTSNHPIDKFDASLRRRTWFVGFSDYYHPEDLRVGVVERSPRTEFGKNIPGDLSPEEMNKFYNFMAYCLHTYMKFRIRINPPMDSIEKRNIQRIITDEFIWWADDYFTEDKLNAPVNRADIFEAWKNTLSDSAQKVVRTKTLREKLVLYCQYKNYTFCPDDVLATATEKERREIRQSKDGKDIYCYFLRTSPDAPIKEMASTDDDSKPSGFDNELKF